MFWVSVFRSCSVLAKHCDFWHFNCKHGRILSGLFSSCGMLRMQKCPWPSFIHANATKTNSIKEISRQFCSNGSLFVGRIETLIMPNCHDPVSDSFLPTVVWFHYLWSQSYDHVLKFMGPWWLAYGYMIFLSFVFLIESTYICLPLYICILCFCNSYSKALWTICYRKILQIFEKCKSPPIDMPKNTIHHLSTSKH